MNFLGEGGDNTDALIRINEDSMTVSARELHEKLEPKTPFNKWFLRMCEYGFDEGTDFWTKKSKSTERRFQLTQI